MENYISFAEDEKNNWPGMQINLLDESESFVRIKIEREGMTYAFNFPRANLPMLASKFLDHYRADEKDQNYRQSRKEEILRVWEKTRPWPIALDLNSEPDEAIDDYGIDLTRSEDGGFFGTYKKYFTSKDSRLPELHPIICTDFLQTYFGLSNNVTRIRLVLSLDLDPNPRFTATAPFVDIQVRVYRDGATPTKYDGRWKNFTSPITQGLYAETALMLNDFFSNSSIARTKWKGEWIPLRVRIVRI